MTRLWLCALMLACAGCSGEPDPKECGSPKPAFALTVATDDGAMLPKGTLLLITGGGGQEYVDPNALPASPKIAFCHTEGKDAQKTSLVCAVWTDGAMMLNITSPGFESLDKTYESKSDKCGIETSDVSVVLKKKNVP